MSWTPSLGAWPDRDGTRFRVWAPTAAAVDLVLESSEGATHRLAPTGDGYHEIQVSGIGAGARYRYRLDGGDALPDPASRSQPGGVHGPSEVVDPSRYAWADADWRGVRQDDLVIYELHVGTFSSEGTFTGAIEHLPALVDLGVTAIELMPIADFAGDRNWGYDGAALFAPARCYGSPDDLRRLVDAAHQAGLAVLLDVVYNHFGPDGAYAGTFSPFYFSTRHQSPWGAGINLDGEHSAEVRAFFIENALHWLVDYHLDGLRFDATHALTDDSPVHLLAELTDRVRSTLGDRPLLLTAEDERNLAYMVQPTSEGGWGLDAVWADDFHHELRRLVAGDEDGYYRDFTGSIIDLARTIDDGWFYRGQDSVHMGGPRGTDPTAIAPPRFIVCIQNHDQVGNRAMGDRLNHAIDPAVFRAASALLFCLPETPLLFMGQEWAAGTPFQYFTDHHAELGRLVTEGRRKEFRHFKQFADAAAAQKIPDPQAPSTFVNSRLRWDERAQPAHATVLRLYRALLALRHHEPACRETDRTSFHATAIDEDTLQLWRGAPGKNGLLGIFRLRGHGRVEIDAHLTEARAVRVDWRPILTTEDPDFAIDPMPMRIELTRDAMALHFARPAAVIFRAGA